MASRFFAHTNFIDLVDRQTLWNCESISPKTIMIFPQISSISGFMRYKPDKLKQKVFLLIIITTTSIIIISIKNTHVKRRKTKQKQK